MDYKKDAEIYFNKLKQAMDMISMEELNTFMNVLVEAKEKGRTIFIMGNGGSSSTASHYVCDFNKGVSMNQEKKFKLICLNDNIPSLMAYANDFSFEEVFIEQLKTFFKKDDVVLGISGSGNSKNVLKAIDYANQNAGITIGMTGYNGGKLKEMAKYSVHIPVDDMQIAEDLHMVLGHCMMKIFSNIKC